MSPRAAYRGWRNERTVKCWVTPCIDPRQFGGNFGVVRLPRWSLATLLTEENKMNRIIYIVGLVVIVLVILGFFGRR